MAKQELALQVTNNRPDARRACFRSYLAAYQLLKDLKATHSGRKVRLLDIGGAHGIHTRFFRDNGIEVTLVDIKAGEEMPDFVGDYLDYNPVQPFDAIWSSHVVEHVPNPSQFLRKMHLDLAEDGYCAITVPPLRENKMGYAHLTLWNSGVLLLNAVKAGFDPATARIGQYQYNLSLIARKRNKPQLGRYLDDFPPEMRTNSPLHIKGNVEFVNWEVKEEDLPRLPRTCQNMDEASEIMQKKRNFLFCNILTKANKEAFYYYDRNKRSFYDCG